MRPCLPACIGDRACGGIAGNIIEGLSHWRQALKKIGNQADFFEISKKFDAMFDGFGAHSAQNGGTFAAKSNSSGCHANKRDTPFYLR